MASSLMNTGISGLKAAQNKLGVVSNNINNAYTPGYNRQHMVLKQADATKSNAGFIGNGVAFKPINRVYNEFVVGQLREAESKNGSADVYHDRLVRVDNFMADTETGLSAQLDNTFTSINGLSADVSRQSSRQAVVSSLESLTARFNSTGDILKKQMDGVNVSIKENVDQANDYIEKIAELNERISKIRGASDTGEPNSLLDERDKLVTDLNKIMGIEVLVQGDQYNISTAHGLNLIQNDTYNKLSVEPSSEDASVQSVIFTEQSGLKQELNSKFIQSGALNGLLKFREGPLENARNQLGLIAINLAERFNEVHQSGIDIKGNEGQKVFSYDAPETLTNRKNSGSANISVMFDSVKDLKASDYRVKYTNDGWEVTRLSDNSSFTPEEDAGELLFDGMIVDVSGSPNVNDSFLIHSVTHAASSLNLLVKDPDEIATGIDDADNGVGDNRNIMRLLNIQNEKLINGTATLSSSYGKLISFLGNETHFAEVTNDVFKKIVNEITEQNQSISGVNLDEEYVSMQVYMKYYQANAKVIDSATTLFDTLLALRG